MSRPRYRKKFISAVCAALSLLLPLPLLVSCAGEGTGETEEVTYVSMIETENGNDPKIPAADYEGYEFSILCRPYNEGLAYSCNYIDSDGESADILASAVFRRNTVVEDKYNVRISRIDSTDPRADVRTQVMSGAAEFDMITCRSDWLATLARENLLADLLSFERFDMSKPYWDQNAKRDLKIGGRLYFTNSDFVAQELGFLLYFNKQMIEDYQLTSPYQYMAENNWTLDTFGALVKSISQDADNDGDMDEFDRYGWLVESFNARALLYASGIRATTNDESGYPALTLMSDRTVAAYEKIKDIFTSGAVWNITPMPGDSHGFNDKWDYMRSWFCQDMFLFHLEGVNIIAQFADMEHEFGIVPMPKLDASQEGYRSFYPYCCAMLAIPSTVSSAEDKDKIGRIVEDLNYYSNLIVMPTFYETILQRKYTHDDESEANLDIIKNSRVYDLAICFDFGGVRSKILDVDCSNANISTSYAKLKKAIESDIEATYAKFSSAS